MVTYRKYFKIMNDLFSQIIQLNACNFAYRKNILSGNKNEHTRITGKGHGV
jgi:hypothetical protein